MATLSFCIPIETQADDPAVLAKTLLGHGDLDLEVILSARTDYVFSPELLALSQENAQLVLSGTCPATATEHDVWVNALQIAQGTWVAMARPADMMERELVLVADYLAINSPQIDAVAWNVLQIDPFASRDVRQSVAIPIDYGISAFDKTVMLQNFFAWQNSYAAPVMPFGLYHGMVRKSLAETVLATLAASGRKPCLPQYEWAARVVLLANDLAFASRPMSAAAVSDYRAPQTVSRSSGFPFDASLGVTGGIAEIQFSLLREMGSEWAGGEEAFVRACIIDCMKETTEAGFAAKAQAYYEALVQWHGGRFVSLFQPEFVGNQPKDIRRGLHDDALMIDRFIGGSRTPQDFYRIVRSFLAPIRLICGGATV